MKTLAKARLLVTRFPYSSQFGGEELHTLTLMQALDQRGIQSFFVGSCPVLLKEFKKRHFEVRRAWLSKPPVTRVRLLVFTLLSPLLFLLAGWTLARARRTWKVDTVYMLSLTEKLLMTPWAHWWKMRVVWVEHARIGTWLTRNPWRGLYHRWSRWASVVVTSHAMVPLMAPWVERVRAIPCGLLLERPSALRPELRDFLKGGFGVVCVARLTLDKGVDMLVQTVHSKPEMRLVLVGNGPLAAVLTAACPERVRVVHELPRGELMALYAAADLCVLPSREMDPFGMVAAEAMAMGSPVLLTRACGISEDLTHGVHAWIVEPTLKELDRGLKRLMKDSALRAELAHAGQKFIRAQYPFEAMVGKWERVFSNS